MVEVGYGSWLGRAVVVEGGMLWVDGVGSPSLLGREEKCDILLKSGGGQRISSRFISSVDSPSSRGRGGRLPASTQGVSGRLPLCFLGWGGKKGPCSVLKGRDRRLSVSP